KNGLEPWHSFGGFHVMIPPYIYSVKMTSVYGPHTGCVSLAKCRDDRLCQASPLSVIGITPNVARSGVNRVAASRSLSWHENPGLLDANTAGLQPGNAAATTVSSMVDPRNLEGL